MKELTSAQKDYLYALQTLLNGGVHSTDEVLKEAFRFGYQEAIKAILL